MSDARFARRWTEERDVPDDHRSIRMPPRLAPRLDARCRASKAATRSPAAPNTPIPCGCPACCMPSCSAAPCAHGRIKSIDTSAAKQVAGRASRRHHRRRAEGACPIPITGRRSTTSRSSPTSKVRFVGEPVAAVLATDPHVAEQAVQLITAEYEELPAIYDEVEALTSNVYVHDELQASRCLRRSEAPERRQEHQHRARATSCAAATSTRPTRRPSTGSSTSSRPRRCCTCRSSRSPASADYKRHTRHVLRRLAGAVVRAHRDRPPARLAGKQGADQGAVSRLGLWLQALHQARGAGARALHDRAQAGEGRAAPSRRCSTRSREHPSTFRIKSGVDKNGKIVARKCEVFWNGGAYADIGPRVTQKSGLTRVRALRHRQCLDRFVRALHQRDAGRRAARLRRAAAGVGLREPHRHDGARAQARSGRVPPQEPDAAKAARTPPARSWKTHPLEKVHGQGARADELVGSRSTAAPVRSGAAAASPSPSRR